MPRVVAILSTQDDRTRKTGVAKLAVGAFAAHHSHKPGGFQTRNQLTDLSRHGLVESRFGCGTWFVNFFQAAP